MRLQNKKVGAVLAGHWERFKGNFLVDLWCVDFHCFLGFIFLRLLIYVRRSKYICRLFFFTGYFKQSISTKYI